jgi:RNA polymerase sigma factor (sigma-70 family)
LSTDINAIEAVQQGERDRFAELIDRHQRMVYGIAWSYLGDPDICEDAAQETFIKAFHYLGALRDPEKFTSWLARIARNVCTSILRKRQSELKNLNRWQIDQPATTTEVESSEEEENLSEMLGHTLSELKPEHRECLTLFYMEGKSVRETAEALGMNESAVKTRLHRARKTLRSELDKRIETQLEGLAPNKNFTASVMVILPQAGILGTAGVGTGASLFGKAVGGLGKGLIGIQFIFWMVLGQTAYVYLLTSFFARLEISNLIDKPENTYRKSLIKKDALIQTLTIPFLIPVTFIGLFLFGLKALVIFLTLMFALGVYHSVLMLRVNKSSFSYNMLTTNSIFCLSMILISIFDFPFDVFSLGLATIAFIHVFTKNPTLPRHDYNLFLRQVQGELQTPDKETSITRPVTQQEHLAFVRFLGEQHLITGYKQRNKKTILQLPTVSMSYRNYLFITIGGESTLKVNRNGQCQATISRSDTKSIQSLGNSPIIAEELQKGVEHAIEQSLALFLEGKSHQARQILTPLSDEDVFKANHEKSASTRIRKIAALLCGILLITLTFYNPDFSGRDPVTKQMARQQIHSWVTSNQPIDENYELLDFWRAPIHPSLELIGRENTPEYKQLVTKGLKANLTNSSNKEKIIGTRITNVMKSPDLLYLAMSTPILSHEELAELGYTEENIRSKLIKHQQAGEKSYIWYIFSMPSRSSFTHDFGEGQKYISSLRIKHASRRLYILKEFNCLDLFDTDAIAQKVADYQIKENFPLPKGCLPIDQQLTNGLFHGGTFNVADTYESLLILKLTDRLDLIDRQACIDGLVRLRQAGFITKKIDNPFISIIPRKQLKDIIDQNMSDKDGFYFMESMVLLNALDQVEDLQDWQFHPETGFNLEIDSSEPSFVTAESLTTWAYQERLEQRQREMKEGLHLQP